VVRARPRRRHPLESGGQLTGGGALWCSVQIWRAPLSGGPGPLLNSLLLGCSLLLVVGPWTRPPPPPPHAPPPPPPPPPRSQVASTISHQMSDVTKRAHPTRLGRPSSVGSFAPPPGHPAAGRWAVCVSRVVPVLPLLLCTRPARARPSIGGDWGSKVKAPLLPLRASSRLPWSAERVSPPGAGALECGNRRLPSDWLIRPSGPKSR
jgi:hypothetical protein